MLNFLVTELGGIITVDVGVDAICIEHLVPLCPGGLGCKFRKIPVRIPIPYLIPAFLGPECYD